jgi:CheY-like chemotaxis protein
MASLRRLYLSAPVLRRVFALILPPPALGERSHRSLARPALERKSVLASMIACVGSWLDLARKHRPDLILMDVQLPEVSGLEVTKWLKEDPELKAIPVIAVTAFAMQGDEERIREGGCEAYLSKPISVAKFIETIRRFLGLGLTIPAVSRGK